MTVISSRAFERLTLRLAEHDQLTALLQQRIKHLLGVIAEKDKQIAALESELGRLRE